MLGLVFGVFRVWTEVPSTVFANLVASVPAYYLNRSWSWGKSGRSHVFKEVVPFWTMTAIGITLSIGTASLAHHLSNVYNLHHFGRTVVVEGANTGAFALLWIVKFLVFNRLFHVDPIARGRRRAVHGVGGRGGRGRALTLIGRWTGPWARHADTAGEVARQSLKFWNCRGIPKSCSLSALMTACRSSRFLPVTRSWSPWACDDTPFRFMSLMNLLRRLA